MSKELFAKSNDELKGMLKTAGVAYADNATKKELVAALNEANGVSAEVAKANAKAAESGDAKLGGDLDPNAEVVPDSDDPLVAELFHRAKNAESFRDQLQAENDKLKAEAVQFQAKLDEVVHDHDKTALIARMTEELNKVNGKLEEMTALKEAAEKINADRQLAIDKAATQHGHIEDVPNPLKDKAADAA